MPAAFGASIGSGTSSAATISVSFTTSAAVPAGGTVLLGLSYFKSAGTKTPSGLTVGGNAATLDKRTTNGSDLVDIWSYYSAAGLASGVTVTATWAESSGMGGQLIGGCYATGLPSTAAFDIGGQSTGTGASLSSGAATNTVNATDSFYFGAVGLEDPTSPTTSTATNGTEVHDLYLTADQQGLWTGYLVVTSSASRAITATASNSASTANTGALAIYAGASAGGGVTVNKTTRPRAAAFRSVR